MPAIIGAFMELALLQVEYKSTISSRLTSQKLHLGHCMSPSGLCASPLHCPAMLSHDK